MSHSIKLEITPRGDVVIKDVAGGGSTCTEITKKLEALMGAPDENSRSYTDEYLPEQEEGQSLEI